MSRARCPTRVDGRFDMIAAVLAMVMLRLEGDPAGVPGATHLAEAFVDDMDPQLREIGIGDLLVGKHIGRMMGMLGGRLGAYRDGLAAGDLKPALVRNLYRGEAPGDARAGACRARIAGAARGVGERRHRPADRRRPAVSAPEFSHAVERSTRSAPSRARSTIAADEAERAALAERFDLIAIDRLTARFTIRRDAAGIVAEGRVDSGGGSGVQRHRRPAARDHRRACRAALRRATSAAGRGRGRTGRRRPRRDAL